MIKELGRIVNDGMGGFLCPPTHPMHSFSVETDLKKRRENRGAMSLEYAVKDEYLADETRKEAKKILDDWQRPPIDSPEVQEWILQVIGYFRSCYKGEDGPEAWSADKLRIDSKADPLLNADLHAGVRLIRQYYPEFQPEARHFGQAYWGKKPEAVQS